MSFIIVQLSLTYYGLGVTISFCKFWFENDNFDTATDLLTSPFFDSS